MSERKKPAVSFTTDDWAKLRERFEAGRELEDAVLYVMLCTSIRIGDVLRVEVGKLRYAVRHNGIVEVVQKGGRKRQLPVDGASEAWSKLAVLCDQTNAAATTVAAAVCPTSSWGDKGGGGAYQRVNRHLRAVCLELGVDGRAHLHRIRRTLATVALKHTRDIHLVSQLLGHSRVRSTESYLDEPRGDEVASLQRQLRGDD